MTENRKQMSDKKNVRRSFRSDIRHLFSVFCLTSVFCLLVSGCGFHSMYGTHDDSDTTVAEELNNVEIENIADRNGQMLRNNLIDRMYGKGRPQNPQYHLAVNLRSFEEGIGLLPDATTSLTELNLYADYTLKDENGKDVVKATEHATATYNQLPAAFGAYAADQNAYQSCITEITEQIVNRVGLYFSEGTTIKPPSQEPAPTPIPGLTPGVTR
jgi:LPS-assembly lipoprotein